MYQKPQNHTELGLSLSEHVTSSSSCTWKSQEDQGPSLFILISSTTTFLEDLPSICSEKSFVDQFSPQKHHKNNLDSSQRHVLVTPTSRAPPLKPQFIPVFSCGGWNLSWAPTVSLPPYGGFLRNVTKIYPEPHLCSVYSCLVPINCSINTVWIRWNETHFHQVNFNHQTLTTFYCI